MSGVDFNVAKIPHSIYTPADELEADQAARLRARAEAWHAPYCEADAGGACVLHLDEKEAWIAGYEAASAERGIPVQRSEPQVLEAILAELKHLNAADRSGSVSSIAFEDAAKGDPRVTTKHYVGSPLTRQDVDAALDVHAYAHAEAARRAMSGWQVMVDTLAAQQ